MKKTIMNILTAVLATTILFTSCTSRTAVDTSSSGSDVSNQANAVTSNVADDSVTDVTTETFDINDYTFDNVYGSQVINYLNHQYYFDGEPIPIVESNYYFVNAFLELSQYASGYGYYPVTSEGYMDLCAEVPLSETGEQPKYKTYGDFFRDYAETMLHSSYIVLRRAQEQNIVLDDATVQEIEALLQGVETNNAAPEGMTLDEYLSLYYGPDCSKETFTQVLYNYYLNDVYTQKYTENYEMPDGEVTMSPTVRYALYYAPAAESDETQLADAKAQADAMFEACGGDIDVFADLGSQAYANSECKEYGELTVTEGQTVPEFDAWCFDSARQPGDIEVIYTEAYGYFVVAYVSLDVNESALQDAAAKQLSNEIGAILEANTYDFHTDDEFLPPPEVAGNEMITGSDKVTSYDATIDSESSEVIASDNAGTTNGNNKTLLTILIITSSLLILAIIVIIVLKCKGNKDKNDSPKSKKTKDLDDDVE